MAVLVTQTVVATEEQYNAVNELMGDDAPTPSVEIAELFDVIKGA